MMIDRYVFNIFKPFEHFFFQDGLASARLVKWTKGFCCSGVEGQDVCELLRQSLRKRGDVKIELCAILNDTTGENSLLRFHLKGPQCN